MSIEQVIAQGDAIQQEVIPFLSESTNLYRIILGLFVGLAVGMLIYWFKQRDTWQFGTAVFLTLVVGSMMFLQYAHELDLAISRERQAVTAWRKEVVNPYIASLPIEKKELYDVEIKSFEKPLFQPEDEQGRSMSHVILTYQDKGIVKEEGLIEIHSDLKTGEKPYLSYQMLTKDLGHGIDAGEYNQVLHLSEEQVLLEIKTSN